MRRRRTDVEEEETEINKAEEGVGDMKEDGEDIREDVEDTEDGVRSCSKSALSGDITHLTPRRSQAVTATLPSPVYPQTPGTPPFPNLTHCTATHLTSHHPIHLHSHHITPLLAPQGGGG